MLSQILIIYSCFVLAIFFEFLIAYSESSVAMSQNGSLLRKYTYLGNDSSYSVSYDDDVDILLLDNKSTHDDKKLDQTKELSVSSNPSSNPECDTNVTQSFTFEAQVCGTYGQKIIFYF